ncbi:YMGG-like glycine zipper-containing protein [Dyadobacter sp. CY107]|uniref:glycine zipper family protein n=1 Tax=Dyadobacter fanqingshengii TaxID=2906443 RepID=UPI001F415042|nr:YMGG-like glycine zipper-containing protein [Dyadobacter fanqingshengii]MCF2506084.1 YMGG-like glycine zipper-containing protein [Dyadobacter fanqingshengii]
MNKLPISIISAAIFMASCNSSADKEATLLKEKQIAIDSMKHVMEKKAIVDSMNTVMANREAEKKAEEARVAEEKSSQSVAANSSAHAPAARKKGWNHTAKGAVVGAGTGAITGAIVNKKRGEGALVGSLIGAGVGAGTGAIVDHSKKKKRNNN